jgi:hypothetical protein
MDVISHSRQETAIVGKMPLERAMLLWEDNMLSGIFGRITTAAILALEGLAFLAFEKTLPPLHP